VAKQKVDLDGIFEIAERRKAGEVIPKVQNIKKEKEDDKISEEPEEDDEDRMFVKRTAKPVKGVKRVYKESPSPYSSQQWDYIDYVDDTEIKYDFTGIDRCEELGEKKKESISDDYAGGIQEVEEEKADYTPSYPATEGNYCEDIHGNRMTIAEYSAMVSQID